MAEPWRPSAVSSSSGLHSEAQRRRSMSSPHRTLAFTHWPSYWKQMPAGDTLVRVACDSLVALGNSTRDGNVLFAKNSDRPAFECQPLVQVAAKKFATSSRLRCTYIEIPQAAHTARVIGSQPYWCWGFE